MLYQKKLSILPKFPFITTLNLIFCFLFSIAGAIISVIRYQQYDVYYYDFGIFDTAIWKVAHFKPPIIDHLVIGGKWIFADHFNPSIFLLSPLYWFSNNPEIILIAQAIVVGLSGIVLYKIGQNVLKQNLISFSIVVSYLLFVGVQNAVITDFHEITIAVFPFMLCIYGLLKKQPFIYWISLIILLGFKESNFLIGIGIGILAYLLNKQNRKLPIITIIFSILWGFIAIHFIIPAFSGGIYQYTENVSYNPISLLSSLFDNPVKRHTIFFSYMSFGFLPLFSPTFWFLQFQDFLTRMYSPLWPTRWTLGLHYSIMTGAILAISSLFSVRFILRFVKLSFLPTLIAFILIGNAIFLYRFVLRGPFALSYNNAFYQHTKDFIFLNKIIAKISPLATVEAPNNLVSHFTHQTSWMLRSNHVKGNYDSFEEFKPQYILIDMRSGQNPNNFFGISDLQTMYTSLTHDSHYNVYYHNGDQYIFKRVKY